MNIIESRDNEKTLKHPQRMNGSDEVVAMMTSIRDTKGESIVIREFTREDKNGDLLKVSGQ